MTINLSCSALGLNPRQRDRNSHKAGCSHVAQSRTLVLSVRINMEPSYKFCAGFVHFNNGVVNEEPNKAQSIGEEHLTPVEVAAYATI